MFNRTIQSQLFSRERVDGVIYSVVQYQGGGYGIAHNGQPIEAYVWGDDNVASCIALFDRLVGDAASPAKPYVRIPRHEPSAFPIGA